MDRYSAKFHFETLRRFLLIRQIMEMSLQLCKRKSTKEGACKLTILNIKRSLSWKSTLTVDIVWNGKQAKYKILQKIAETNISLSLSMVQINCAKNVCTCQSVRLCSKYDWFSRVQHVAMDSFAKIFIWFNFSSTYVPSLCKRFKFEATKEDHRRSQYWHNPAAEDLPDIPEGYLSLLTDIKFQP